MKSCFSYFFSIIAAAALVVSMMPWGQSAIAQSNGRAEPAGHNEPGPRLGQPVVLVGPTQGQAGDPTGIESYTAAECRRVFQEHRGIDLVTLDAQGPSAATASTVVIGTAANNPLIAKLLKDGFLEAPTVEQGYAMRCAPHPENPDAWLLAMAGTDNRGALYALRDLEHYELGHFVAAEGRLAADPFTRSDYPRIQHRGHWVWGCNMPDKEAWLDNMSRWKMNELIHWDNYLAEDAKAYVEFAHERGIRVIWGFGWGWNPDWNFDIPEAFDHGVGQGVQMCSSDAFNRRFFREEILRKVREDYAPTGCDGIYFQSFTEVPKCQCSDCAAKTKGQLMLEFIEPIIDDIKAEFPDLWISCGVHRNLGHYEELRDLDPRCNIYWENCPSGVSIRGDDEDFGYINKTLPYAHGFSETCAADPEYTEASLQAWMESNAHRYTLRGGLGTYRDYLSQLQSWARGMMGKPEATMHGTTVACHSVFCRRTPFMHVALAEAMWNPEAEPTGLTVGIVTFLQDNGGLPGFIGETSGGNNGSARLAQHDGVGKALALATEYSPRYTGGGDGALTDGVLAIETNASDPGWQGYEKQNLDVVIDLEGPMSINVVSAAFLHQPRAGVHLPRVVEFAYSRDGETFEAIGVVESEGDPTRRAGNSRNAYSIGGLDLERVRYLRVRADYTQHWLFIDEVQINPLVQEN